MRKKQRNHILAEGQTIPVRINSVTGRMWEFENCTLAGPLAPGNLLGTTTGLIRDSENAVLVMDCQSANASSQFDNHSNKNNSHH
jgi:hypothetical protein